MRIPVCSIIIGSPFALPLIGPPVGIDSSWLSAMSADELQDVTVEGLRQDALLGGTKRLVPISSVQPIMVFGLAI
jgi:hypothetical protein